MRKLSSIVIVLQSLSIFCWATLALSPMPALSWWADGHQILTTAAVLSLRGTSVPQFFIDGAELIAHCSVDPDLLRNPATRHAGEASSPDHFFDLEFLSNTALPKDRWTFITTCFKRGLSPSKVGFLPYVVIEKTEALSIAFAEHRRWPNDSLVRQKCLVYAGNLAHFAQDLCQPLHLTIHYDGRRMKDGSIRKNEKGIHAKVDGLIEKLGFCPNSLVSNRPCIILQPLVEKVFERVFTTHRLVDSTYALSALINGSDYLSDQAVRSYARLRAEEAVQFTASIFFTAWELSEKISFDSWLDRAKSPIRLPATSGQTGYLTR